jgi:predicted Zn-dependent protease
MRAKSFQKADQTFNLILKRSPEIINILYLKAESSALQDKQTEAIALFEKVESLDPKHVKTKMSLAKLYMSQGYKEKGMAKIREASLLAPNDKKIQSILKQF